MRASLTCAVVAGATSLMSCATTEFVSTWKAPDAQSLKNEGSKVATVVLARSDDTRRSAEDDLARELTRRGAQGIPAYTLIEDEAMHDEAKARHALEMAGVAIIVVMLPTSTREVSANPMTGATYWSGGYYSYGWQAAYSPGTSIRTDTIVYIQTSVYSMKQNKLVWSGQSRTANPNSLASLLKEVIQAVGEEMKKEGLI
jgi:hypothetical protein